VIQHDLQACQVLFGNFILAEFLKAGVIGFAAQFG
jgi:hypothetical protein